MNDVKKWDKFETLKYGTHGVSIGKFISSELKTVNITNFPKRIGGVRNAVKNSITRIIDEAQERLDASNKKVVQFRKIRDAYKKVWGEIDDLLKEEYIKWDEGSGTEYTEEDGPLTNDSFNKITITDWDKIDKKFLKLDEVAIRNHIKKSKQNDIEGIIVDWNITKIRKPLYDKAIKILNSKAQIEINKFTSEEDKYGIEEYMLENNRS